MHKKLFFTLFAVTGLLSMISFRSLAQNEDIASNTSVQVKNEKKIHPKRNLIKLNLAALIFKNYSIQYERILNRKFSFAFSYRIMPATTLPLQSSVLKIVGDDDPETKKTIEDFRLSNYAITPELRFYVSKKGYGRGFYIAPFYRYASFKTNNLDIFYSDSAGVQSSIKLSGKFSSGTFGLLFGVQHSFGKHIVLDIWLFGPHYGSGKGDFTGIPGKPLTKNDQDDLRDRLNSIVDISLIHRKVDVDANSASLKIDGPWGGIRSGFSLGIRF